MIKKLAPAGALTIALAVSACNQSGSLNVSTTNEIAKALAVGCPALATVESLRPPMNAGQKAATATLALACPPNPPPTSGVVAVEDLLAAYATLRPLLD